MSGQARRSLVAGAALLLAAASPVQDTRNAEVDQADAELNETFAALMKRLGSADRTALRRAQRAWIQFRDADCRVDWGDRRDCILQRTLDRDRQLRETAYFAADGKPFLLPRRRD